MVIGNLRSFMLYRLDICRESLGNMQGNRAGQDLSTGGIPSKVFLSCPGFVSLYFPELGNLNSDAVGELFVEFFAVAEEEQNLQNKA